MKKVYAMLFMLAVPVFAGASEAVEKRTLTPYVSFRFGGGIMSVGEERDIGGASFGFAVGLERALTDNMAVRVEAESSFNRFEGVAERNIRGTPEMFEVIHVPRTYMANAYLDFLTDRRLRPYIGFGVGAMSQSEGIEAQSDGFLPFKVFDLGVAVGLYAGVGFNLTSSGNFIGDVGVRHVVSSFVGADVSMTNFNFGWRRVF